MRKTSIALALLAALITAACATGYHSADYALSGGYTETRLAPNQWRVLVKGNSFTSRSEAEQILMRRCAELTLETGRRWFVLDEHEAWLDRRMDEDGDVFVTPANAAIVTALREESERAFDAIEIVKETNELAEGRLSARAKETMQLIEGGA